MQHHLANQELRRRMALGLLVPAPRDMNRRNSRYWRKRAANVRILTVCAWLAGIATVAILIAKL